MSHESVGCLMKVLDVLWECWMSYESAVKFRKICFRLQWVAHLEFSHNKEVPDLSWDKLELTLPRTEKLSTMIQNGIPHSLRPQLWMRMSGISCFTYCSIISHPDLRLDL